MASYRNARMRQLADMQAPASMQRAHVQDDRHARSVRLWTLFLITIVAIGAIVVAHMLY